MKVHEIHDFYVFAEKISELKKAPNTFIPFEDVSTCHIDEILSKIKITKGDYSSMQNMNNKPVLHVYKKTREETIYFSFYEVDNRTTCIVDRKMVDCNRYGIIESTRTHKHYFVEL